MAVAETETGIAAHEWARDPEERYGIYRAVLGSAHPMLIATTSKEGIGTALVQLREEDEFGDRDRIGVLDGIEGKWIINPYARGR